MQHAKDGGPASAKTSASALGADEIIPRDIRFGIVDDPQRHWFSGSLEKTALFDGLSMFLPEGERFFIRSLKHYAASLKDKELAREINGYAVQEAFHTREHEDYNRALAALGYDVEAMEGPIRDLLRKVNDPLIRLAVTCAIEHLTATVSSVTLRRPDLLDGAAAPYRRLWMWHALEELEHKAVALDVFAAATRHRPGWQRYLLRTGAMNATLFRFAWISLRNVGIYARSDGVKTGLGFWLRFLGVVLVKPGYWRLTIGPLLRYYMPGFDPRNVDDVDLIHKGRDWLATELSGDYARSPRAAT